ncbi:hypothetical protein ANO11243_048170 [Dothideomycetidae sp. 11243]|nr:hypothetical protein ANO11243_048170 [fungal sp. No.11243]
MGDASPDAENEQDSPLDTANFLSFEEWKRKNLEKVGQSPEHVGQHRSPEDLQRRRRPGINNALDVLGEDSEIELDFSGFGAPSPPSPSRHSSRDAAGADESGALVPEKLPSQQITRSKDAGRTCKERTNYASFDCAATVLKTNPECKSASSVLVENKDSYMLNICKVENKFFIVELCDDILVDTLVLANYEFFSSIFRTFRLSVSDRYPIKQDKWRDLGVYEARNTRDIQAFLIEQPLIWARYMRIEFLTHYGNEYYCPVSLLRVHGTTMMEEFRHQEEIARGDFQEEEVVESENPTIESAIEQQPMSGSLEADKSLASTVDTSSSASAATQNRDASSSRGKDSLETASVNINPAPDRTEEVTEKPSRIDTDVPTSSYANDATAVLADMVSGSNITSVQASTNQTTLIETTISGQETSIPDVPPVTSITAALSAPSSALDASEGSDKVSTSGNPAKPYEKEGTQSIVDSTKEVPAPFSKTASSSQTTTESPKRATHTTNGAQPVPSTQESFFKSIHKRLQMLESNSTLSLQYIEEQSRILRDAFSKVEKRQVRKTERFLEELNATVNAELRSFRTEYDQLWQSTVIELETHRRLYQQEILAVSARLNLVAEELLFQKRMTIVQSTLLVMCVALVLFHRAGPNALDLPILHQMLNKSALLRGPSGMYSPPSSPPAPRDKHYRSFWRRSLSPGLLAEMVPNEGDVYEDEEALSPSGIQHSTGPDLRFQPPTPTSPRSMNSEGDEGDEEVEIDDEGGVMEETYASPDEEYVSGRETVPESINYSLAPPLETQSGPATPTGTRNTSPLVPIGHSKQHSQMANSTLEDNPSHELLR